MIALAKLPKAEPNEALCQMLMDLLEEAQSGRLRSLIGVKIFVNDDSQTVWAKEYGDAHPVLILGALRMLMRDWEDRIKEKRGDPEAGDAG